MIRLKDGLYSGKLRYDEELELKTTWTGAIYRLSLIIWKYTLRSSKAGVIDWAIHLDRFTYDEDRDLRYFRVHLADLALPMEDQHVDYLVEIIYTPENAVLNHYTGSWDVESGIPPPDKGVISGHVLDQDTKAPIPGATVTYDSGHTTTNEEGIYTSEYLSFSEYDVEASSPNHQKVRKKIQISEAKTYTLDFELAPVSPPPPDKGRISGIVVDIRNDSPIPQAQVSTPTFNTSTFDNGEYTIDELDPGSYAVTVSKSGYEDQTRSVDVVAGETSTLNFAMVWKEGPHPPPVLDCSKPPEVTPIFQPVVNVLWFLFCPFINAILTALEIFDLGKSLENFGKTLSNLLLLNG